MLIDRVNYNSFLNLCIIYNQAKESSFLSIYTLQDKLN